MKNVPEWNDKYGNDFESASLKVKNYYRWLEKQWNNHEKVQVSTSECENTSYYFFYLWKKLDQFYLDQSIETVRRIEPDFKWLIETYSDRVPKLAAYASSWICEMGNLIGNKQIVTEWIQYSKKYLLGISGITPMDILMYSWPEMNDNLKERDFFETISIQSLLTTVGKMFIDEIEELLLIELKKESSKSEINWLYRYRDVTYFELGLPNSNGAHGAIQVRTYKVRENTEKNKKLKELVRLSENKLRKSKNLPLVGAGWISETLLFREIQLIFDDQIVKQHYSPDFLGLQHYDIYFPKYKIALEYQGAQHFEAISIFGGEAGLKNAQERDKRKKEISEINNVKLIEIMPNYMIKEVISSICSECDLSVNKYIKRIKILPNRKDEYSQLSENIRKYQRMNKTRDAVLYTYKEKLSMLQKIREKLYEKNLDFKNFSIRLTEGIDLQNKLNVCDNQFEEEQDILTKKAISMPLKEKFFPARDIVLRKNNFIQVRLKELGKLRREYSGLIDEESITGSVQNLPKKKSLKSRIRDIEAEIEAPTDFYHKYLEREYYPMQVAWFRFFIYFKKINKNQAIEWAKLAIDLNIEVRSGKTYKERIRLLNNSKN